MKYYYFANPFDKESIKEIALDNLDNIEQVFRELYKNNKYRIPLPLVESAIFEYNSGDYKHFEWLASEYMFERNHKDKEKLLARLKDQIKLHMYTDESKLDGYDEDFENLIFKIDSFIEFEDFKKTTPNLLSKIASLVGENPGIYKATLLKNIEIKLQIDSRKASHIYDEALKNKLIKYERDNTNRLKHYISK